MEKFTNTFEPSPNKISERREVGKLILEKFYPKDRPKVAKSVLKNMVPVEELIPGTNTDKVPSLDQKFKSGGKAPERSDPIYTPYIDYAIELVGRLDKRTLAEVRASFKDKIIVDIGAGRFTKGYDLACFLGAKGYIAVEPANFNYSYILMSLAGQKEQENRPVESSGSFKRGTTVTSIPLNVVAEDGLSFLKRLPNNSAVVFTFGLGDGAAIPDRSYLDEMNEEISRVMSKDCYSFSANSAEVKPEGSECTDLFVGKDIPEGTAMRKFESDTRKKFAAIHKI